MWSIIAASVVVLPDPVGPVTSTRPRWCSVSLRHAGGRPSSSNDGMSLCTRRSTRPTEPRWRMTLTRKRPSPDTEYAKSASHGGDELLGALLRHDRERDALGLDRRHLGVVGALEMPVDADERRRAHLDVDVGRAAFDGVP